jgi:hypothetical protein
MKLRIRGNSLRLRLSRSELDTLRDSGRVADSIAFPSGRVLGYAMRVDEQSHTLSAAFSGEGIAVSIPRAQFERWLEPREVGISGTLALPGNAELVVLLEKDFPCLTPRAGEDDSDAFDRSAEAGSHCAPD